MPEIATLAGGCFWCLEAVYSRMDGVSAAISGYMGGHVDQPTYRQVCDGTTGHAEVVQVHYDPAITSFDDLLDVFFAIHDPTTLNRQGNDTGTQYRSAIFFHTPAQQAAATAHLAAEQAHWEQPIVTQLVPAEHFWPAEDYHQDYFTHNGNQPYCAYVVAPKVAKFRKQFTSKWRA